MPEREPSRQRQDAIRRRRGYLLQAGGVLALAVVLSIATAGAVRTDAQPRDKHLAFTATAYCDSGKTKAGVRTRRGVAAADPDVLPVGSVVRVQSPEEPRYGGIYTVMDTGSAVQGRRIDLFIASCREAKEFGLKQVLVRVLRFGWDPQASVSSAGRP